MSRKVDHELAFSIGEVVRVWFSHARKLADIIPVSPQADDELDAVFAEKYLQGGEEPVVFDEDEEHT